MKKIAFIIPPSVELLDLAGPMQVFTEARFYWFNVHLEFYTFGQKIKSSARLPFGEIYHYKGANLEAGDLILITGANFESLTKQLEKEKPFFKWLAVCAEKKVTICSVCNAAFMLGEAGLLKNKECTTHWRRTEALQKRFPDAKVIEDVLFVKSDNIFTSADISAGIDLALALLEEWTNPFFVNKIARGLVVYHRRSHKHAQQHIYLDYRNHVNPKIHQSQDFIIENIANDISIKELAELENTSPRNLSRIFKDTTELTIKEYQTKIRLEKAKTLKNNPEYTIDRIASECDFKSARQLQRILKTH